MPPDTARREALARLLADWEAGRMSEALGQPIDNEFYRLGWTAWNYVDETPRMTLTPAGLAAARAAGEAKDG